ncbi:MAG TPA: hypothetical protein VNM34_14910 [Verrucomicrobiae bacterium]|nr:hypothetical protein [Verrucomicrobiae bacterium]
MRTLAVLVVASLALLALAGCGLLTPAISGVAPAAGTPEAGQLAQQVDESIWRWLGAVFFNIPPAVKVGAAALAGELVRPASRVVRGARHIHRVVKWGRAAARSAASATPPAKVG